MGVAALFWALLYSTALYAFWLPCYQSIFPSWVRWIVPVYGLTLGVLAVLFWWLAQRLPTNPVIGFVILGGLQSFPGHLFGIYRLDLLIACPLLQQVSAGAALTFGFFEFIFYWCVILGLSFALQKGWRYWLNRGTRPGLEE